MNSNEAVGTVRALRRFPVKSMLGEKVETADVSEGGLIGDRAYAVRDKETGKVASAKHGFVENDWPGHTLGGALFPCAGVNAVAEATGTIHEGDGVSLA